MDLIQEINDRTVRIEQCVKDLKALGHEKRISALERWRSGIVAGLLVLTTLVGVLLRVFK